MGEPSASGTLGTTPLANALVYVRNQRLGGRFELRVPDGRAGLVGFWRGRITDARALPASLYFGQVALSLGLIDETKHAATLAEALATKRLHGELLVERGILTGKQRDDALAEQKTRRTQSFFAFPPETTYAFYAETPSTETPPHTVDPLAPIWRGITEYPPPIVAEVVRRYTNATLRMVNEGPLDRVTFSADEKKLLERLAQTPMTIAQMGTVSALTRERVHLLVYLLLVSKSVEPTSVSQPDIRTPVAVRTDEQVRLQLAKGIVPGARLSGMPPARPTFSDIVVPTMSAAARPVDKQAAGSVPPPDSVPRPRSAPPGGAPPSGGAAPASGPASTPLALGAAGLAARAAKLDREDYFASLGLADGAPIEVVRAAYIGLVKAWHPDRLPKELESSRADVSAIFTQITKAFSALSEPAARNAYLASRPKPSANVARPKPPPESLRAIDAALAQRDFVTGERAARKFLETFRHDADLRAIVAWCGAKGGDARDAIRGAIADLDKAIADDERCVRALFFRGLLHKRLGNMALGLRDFARVAQLEPTHVEAERELRVLKR